MGGPPKAVKTPKSHNEDDSLRTRSSSTRSQTIFLGDETNGVSSFPPAEANASSYKPDSKIPFARMSCNVPNPPALFLAEVEVTSKADIIAGTGSQSEPVKSQKLRLKALQELLRMSDFNSVPAAAALNLNARKGQIANARKPNDAKKSDKNSEVNGIKEHSQTRELINHLIIPVKRGKEPHEVLAAKLCEYDFQLGTTRKQAKKLDKQSNGQKDEVICCRILQQGRILEPQADCKLYMKSLDILFRTYAQWDSDEPSYESHAGILLDPPENADTLSLKHFEFGLRTRLRHTFVEHEAGLRLHLDFDLVPTVNASQRVPELLKHYFSSHDLSTALAYDLHMENRIKKLLRGLPVLYEKSSIDAKTPDLGQRHGSSVEFGSGLSHSPMIQPQLDNVSQHKVNTINSVSPGVIKDIKSAKEVGRILVKDANGQRMYTSVKHITKTKSTSSNLNLPLADIGGKRSYWVPLEHLLVRGDQVLKKAGHFTDEIRRFAEGYFAKEDQVRPKACGILDKVNQITKDFEIFPYSQFEIVTQPLVAAKPWKVKSKRLEAASSITEHNLAIIYVTPYDVDPNHDQLLAKIKSRLLDDEQRMVKFAKTIKTAVVSSVQNLIRQQVSMDCTLMQQVSRSESTVILGVIDRDGTNQEKYREIQAELRRFGDRKLGAVTVCVEKQRLLQLLQRPIHMSIFPVDILQKMNFMLGNPNFAPENLYLSPIKPVDRLMVVGAHVSHPASEATEFCPSVAAVVGSVSSQPVVYPGSVHLQPSQRKGAIVGLKDMMLERFSAWKSKHEGESEGTDLPDVVFYRSSYEPGDRETWKEEVSAIKEAHESVFKTNYLEKNGFAYITMSKNLRQYKVPDKNTAAPSFTFTSHEDNDNEAKYQYHVAYNSLNRTCHDIAYLTADLNMTFQLGSFKPTALPLTAKALPLTYAQKLSRRVLDYFHWWSHKDLNNVPVFARQTPYFETKDHAGEAFMSYVEGYLYSKEKKDGIKETKVPFREDRLKCPWKLELDHKMFYL